MFKTRTEYNHAVSFRLYKFTVFFKFSTTIAISKIKDTCKKQWIVRSGFGERDEEGAGLVFSCRLWARGKAKIQFLKENL